MPVTQIAAEVFALAFLLMLAAVLGYGYRGDRNQDEISTAQANYATCNSALTANASKTTSLKASLDDLSARHTAAVDAATKALDGRDKTIEQLRAGAETQSTNIRKSTHENADCAALLTLGICPAVADQLWPAAVKGTATGDHAH